MHVRSMNLCHSERVCFIKYFLIPKTKYVRLMVSFIAYRYERLNKKIKLICSVTCLVMYDWNGMGLKNAISNAISNSVFYSLFQIATCHYNHGTHTCMNLCLVDFGKRMGL